MFTNIELGHLPQLERQMIEYALDSGDLRDCVEVAILNAEDTDEALSYIEEGFQGLFEDELQNEIENWVEGEETERASYYDGGGVGYELADCFQVQVTREVERAGDEPDFERCAVRALAHYATQAYPDGLAGLYEELSS